MKSILFSITKEDCDWQNFTCGGKGGSGKDTSNNGVRCIHRASGARGEARDSRNQLQNRRAAFARMARTEQFKAWHKLETARRLGQDRRPIEEIVEDQMAPENLKIEFV